MSAKEDEEAAAAFARSSPTTDWQYLAEGQLNLVCYYIGSEPALLGHVLRLRKRNEKATGGDVEGVNPWLEGLQFQSKVILPLLGRRFVHPALEVPVSADFLASIAATIESSRPGFRREHQLDVRLKTALLLVDVTKMPSVPGDAPSVCIEMKPKCGFLPQEPWVTHEVKKRQSRFTMHQQLKVGVEGKLDQVSLYDPLDLFSQDGGRVRRAIRSLVLSPQNNLRFFIEGVMVFPDGDGHGSMDMLATAISKASGGKLDADELIEMLAAVLIREPLLPRLLAAQKLDDSDIEGAYKVYCEMAKDFPDEKDPPLTDGPPLDPAHKPVSQLPSKEEPAERRALLRRFMISKTAKDCSIMIALKPDPTAKPDPLPVDAPLPHIPIQRDGVRTIVRGVHGWAYSCAAVDLDPKPWGKMKSYHKLDAQVASTYAKLERAGKLLPAGWKAGGAGKGLRSAFKVAAAAVTLKPKAKDAPQISRLQGDKVERYSGLYVPAPSAFSSRVLLAAGLVVGVAAAALLSKTRA